MVFALYRFERSGNRPDFVVISEQDPNDVLAAYVDDSTTIAEIVDVCADLTSFPCDRPLCHGLNIG